VIWLNNTSVIVTDFIAAHLNPNSSKNNYITDTAALTLGIFKVVSNIIESALSSMNPSIDITILQPTHQK
jgi:hypothetical protein